MHRLTVLFLISFVSLRATEPLIGNKQTRAGGYFPRFAYQRALFDVYTTMAIEPIQDVVMGGV
jgi:hypothetical protein